MEAELDFDQLFNEKVGAYREQVAAERAEQLSTVPERSLIWHALVPAWTLPLAEAAGFPPDGGEIGAAQTFQEMETMGYCLSGQPDFTDRLKSESAVFQTFSMPAAKRAEILQKAALDKGLQTLRKESEIIARKILESEKSVALPADTARWARLAARAANTNEFAVFFDTLTNDLFEAGKSGELLDWIETARSLEQCFGSDVSFTLGRAARRLELFHRRAGDKRRLTKFLERAEQIAAVRSLLENESGEWALHFIGAGGVGKTMLIRHLTTNLSKQMNFAVARVDFDYLNPDYPARSPGLLLAQLAEEFRVFAPDSSVVNLLAGFNEKIVNLHDRFRVAPEQFSVFDAIEPVFQLLPIFAEALSQLGRRPVIVLDTCEELLKIRAGGAVPPSVEATFQMLERLHAQTDSLRVVFGGRRPLASAGAGWTAADLHLPARNYLRVQEIRGFTRDESEKYLGEIEKVRGEAIEPIIKHSAEQIKNSRIRRTAPDLFSADNQRYNPFDLWLYASWLHEDPDLPLDTLETANSESYVEMRIVSRIDNADLRRLLPFVSLLGRFDARTLRAMSEFDESRFDTVFAELSNLEWTNHQAGQTFEVESGLQPRLRSYFEKREPEEFRRTRRKIIDYLENQTLEARRAELDISYFTIVFTLIKSEPERALEWWRKVENRFASEQTCDWLKIVCESILGTETNESSFDLKTLKLNLPNALLLAAVHVSYAASMLQTRSFGELELVWAQAISILEKYEAEEKTKLLLRRARAGRLAAAARFNPQNVGDEEIERLWQTLRELKPGELDFQSAGSLIAVLEAVAEFLENGRSRKFPDSPVLENFAAVLETTKDCKALVSFANAIHGRLLILAGIKNAGLDKLRRALSEKTPVGGKPDSLIIAAQTFLDWLAPAQIESRMRLEFARLAYPAIGAAEILQIIGDKIPEPTTIDSDRLGSAILELRAAVALPFGDKIDELASQSRYFIQHESVCQAHRAFPPLFAAIAEAIAAAGRVDEAIGVLEKQRTSSEQNAGQLDITQESDRALLRIARRMRLRDENIGAETSINYKPTPADEMLLWTVEAVSNPKYEGGLNIESFITRTIESLVAQTTDFDKLLIVVNARFRTLPSIYPYTMTRIAAWLNGKFLSDTAAIEALIYTYFGFSVPRLQPEAASVNTFAALMCFLDCLELNEINRRHKQHLPFPEISLEQIKNTKIWRETIDSDSLERWTLLLRQTALENKRVINFDTTEKNLVEKIGRRRAAQIALDEGELLALRLPERAVSLLNLSHKLFRQSEDYAGQMITRICVSLALARTGGNIAFSRKLSKIENEYNRYFAENIPELPSWTQIKTAAENPNFASLTQIARRGWRPWLIRLIVCMAWEKDGYRGGGRTSEIVRWLEENYGVSTKFGKVLPAELEGWLKPKDSVEPPKPSPVAKTKLNTIIKSADKSLLKSIPIGRTSNKDISYIVQPKPEEFSLAASLTENSSSFEQTLEPETRVNVELRGAALKIDEQFSVQGLAVYRQSALAVSEKIKQSDAVSWRLLAEQKIIEIQVEQTASWICWEAVAGLALQELSKKIKIPPLFRRTVRGTKTKLFKSWQNIDSAVTWANDLYVGDLAHIGWKKLFSTVDLKHEVRGSEFFNSSGQNENRQQVVHIVGTPTETSAGVRLNLFGETFYAESRDIDEAGTGMVSESAPSSRGEFLKADSLVSQFPQMALCVLQAPPREATANSVRSRRDREQAAYLRLMAAEISRLGTPLVITIPALPPEIFVETLRHIANAFSLLQNVQGMRSMRMPQILRRIVNKLLPLKKGDKKPIDTGEAASIFLEAIAKARQSITEAQSENPEDALEMALDISLYAPDAKKQTAFR